MANHTILAYQVRKISSLASFSIMSYIHYLFLFHTLFQCNDTRPQDASLVSHKNAFYHVKVQIAKERDIFIHFKIYLKGYLKSSRMHIWQCKTQELPGPQHI